MREHRILIVAGEDQEERLAPFSCQNEVPPYVVYKYEDAEKLRQRRIQELEEVKKNTQAFGFPEGYVDEELEEVKNMDCEDFFYEFTSGFEKDDDGNAISRVNPEGRYLAISRGGTFSQPFLLKDGTTAYQAKKCDIMWDQLHMNKEFVNLYERTWEMCVEGLEPVSEIDVQVYGNMKDTQEYFERFKDKEEYVTSCSSFWAHSFLNEADMWLDADDCPVSQFEWMSTYYDRFIKPLPEDTLLTIFEYIVV